MIPPRAATLAPYSQAKRWRLLHRGGRNWKSKGESEDAIVQLEDGLHSCHVLPPLSDKEMLATVRSILRPEQRRG